MLEEIRERLRDYLKTHTYRELTDEFGIDHAALYRFVNGKGSLLLSDKVLDMIVVLGVLRRDE